MNIELDLLTACIRSERKAEYELYKMTYGYLMSICFRYTNSREEAEEMLNIGFLKILRNLEKYKLEIPFKLWIRRIMINILIDEFRRNKKHKETIEYVDGYYETGETCDENAIISKMNVDEIHELIMITGICLMIFFREQNKMEVKEHKFINDESHKHPHFQTRETPVKNSSDKTSITDSLHMLSENTLNTTNYFKISETHPTDSDLLETAKNTTAQEKSGFSKNGNEKAPIKKNIFNNDSNSPEQIILSKKTKNSSKSEKELVSKGLKAKHSLNHKKDIKEAATSDGTENKLHATKKEKVKISSKQTGNTEKTGLSENDSALTEKKEIPIGTNDSIIAAIITEVSDSLADSTLKEKALIATDSIQSKVDSSSVQDNTAQLLPMDGLASVTSVSIEAGANGQLGWHYHDTLEGRGIAPVFGISVSHTFNQKWGAKLGLQYTNISHLKNSSKRSVSTIYGLGSTTTETIIKVGVLHYLTAPLTVDYYINNKNIIFTGGSFSILLNKKNKIELNSTSVTPVTSPDNIITENKSGYFYSDAFNRFDASLCIGYRRKISSHFDITTIINYGLIDIKKNIFFAQNKFERNNGLRIILSYTLFDF